jgi:DNA-directed RNA polymerase subunit RPC12/RpoP
LIEVRLGRRPQKLTSYRPMLERRGDVELNAYARHMRRNVLGILLGLVLIGGAAWLFHAFSSQDRVAPQPRVYSDKVRCGECGHEQLVQVSTRDKFPLTCPKCKAHDCWKVWRCAECVTEFVSKVGREDRETAATILRCPKCGSMSVGSAARPPVPAPAAQP